MNKSEHSDYIGTDRRHQENLVKGVILPVVVAVITGSFSSYMATQITLSVVETKVTYIETDIVTIKQLLENVKLNQVELAKRGEWMRGAEKRLSNLEEFQKSVNEQTKDRYTRSEAEKDFQLIRLRLKELSEG